MIHVICVVPGSRIGRWLPLCGHQCAHLVTQRREINRGGLEGLYEITLLASTVEFGQAMKVSSASLQQS